MPVVGVGGTVSLRADVRNGAGQPADATNLTLLVKDPGGIDVAGFPVVEPAIVRDALGTYHYVWSVNLASALGDYVAYWSGQVNGGDVTGQEVVEVVAAGSIGFGEAYLSVDQFRLFEPAPNLGDEALLILLEAARRDIVRVAGTGGDFEELRFASGPLILLARQAATISTVLEDALGSPVTLDATDYELSISGEVLRRLVSGAHPASRWRGAVRVTYTLPDDLATRQRVQVELVKLDLNYVPGAVSETIGAWSETIGSSANGSYTADRAAILATLAPAAGIW